MNDMDLSAIGARYRSHTIVYERPGQHAPCWGEYHEKGRCKCDAETDMTDLIAQVAALRAENKSLEEKLAQEKEQLVQVMSGWNDLTKSAASLRNQLDSMQKQRDAVKTQRDEYREQLYAVLSEVSRVTGVVDPAVLEYLHIPPPPR